jgi:hypothetical protein
MDRQERCRKLVTAINQLGQTQLEELFRLLYSNKCTYTKNTNGVFINLSWIPDSLLDVMEQYIAFCNQSKTEVCKYESLCEALNRNMHSSAQEDMDTVTSSKSHATQSDASAVSTAVASGTRVSSSMKFYLLKKRFSKQNVFGVNGITKNDLKPESYIIT